MKVILDALKEHQTLSELSQKHGLHPNQISIWKTDFLAKAQQMLESKKPRLTEASPKLEDLFSKIDKLQIELDCLKKSCHDTKRRKVRSSQ